jgi:hypothetical protein
MKTFLEYIAEQAEVDGKLKHLQHLEDLHIDHGASGFHHAVATLKHAKEHVESGHENKDITQKIDGAPSVVLGHHPETGKLFVASKSAFNKTPKINYTPEDIERNHGHAPGLVHKLKAVLDHAHKILPKHGVFQGDVLHSGDDVTHGKDKASFKPNTITYTAKGKDAEAVKKSKVGIALHTEYKGKTLEDMKAGPIEDHGVFKKHPDVFNAPVTFKSTGSKMTPAASKKFHAHLDAAGDAHVKIDHDHVSPHIGHINTYVNQTVRNGTTPTHAGLVEHMKTNKEKALASVKTEKSKAQKSEHHDALIAGAEGEHKDSLTHAFTVHKHLQSAKDMLVKHMDKTHEGLESHISGKKVGPEGYVSNHGGKMVKLVNRAGFSAANFAAFGKK